MKKPILLSILIISFYLPCETFAQWSQDSRRPLYIGGGSEPQIASDGSGGVFIVAQRENYRLFAMAVDRYGNQRWEEWLYVGGSSRHSRTPFLSGLGDGTLVIAFLGTEIDSAMAIFDVMVQKIDTSGAFLWGEEGIMVAGEERDDDQITNAVVVHPSGNVFVGWYDLIGNQQQNSYIMAISQEGEILWDEPVGLDWEERLYSDMVMVADSEGVIVGVTTHFNKISNSGELLWGEEGIQFGGNVNDSGPFQIIPPVVSDGEGGVVITYIQQFGQHFVVFAQRLDENGGLFWGEGGIVLSDTLMDIRFTRVAALSDGDFAFAWDIPSENDQYRRNVKMQRLNSDGRILFETSGIEPSNIASSKASPLLVSSDENVIVLWRDNRWQEEELYGICAQKLNRNGERLWDEEDVAILAVEPIIYEYWACSDRIGGGIYYFGSVIMQVSRNGNLGEVLPLSIESRSNHGTYPKKDMKLTCYPNPSNDMIHIHVETFPLIPLKISFYHLNGALIKSVIVKTGSTGNYSSYLTLNGNSSGVYLVRVDSPTGKTISKFCLIK